MKANRKYITLLLLMVFGISCGVLAGAFFGLTHDLPQIQALKSYVPSAVTRIHSTDGVILSELFMEKRRPVSLDDIPHFLKSGLVATEDRNFYRHSGIDLKGILRAVIRDIQARQFVEGASTITQQLAKTLFLTSSKTLPRKIKEAILAFQIERRYTKDEILALYLNQIYLGSGAYGVESAAGIFFDKSVKHLNLPECALIAAMPKAPSRFSPLVNRELAERRRNIVLKQMFATGIIQENDYQAALKTPVKAAGNKNTASKSPYFVEYAKRDLEKNLGPSQLYKGGLNIYSTLSFEMQSAAEIAVRKGLADLESRMKRQAVPVASLQAALIALQVDSGAILAMVGGKDYYESSYNRATMAKRQPGSAFKPIIYALAVENGFSQNRMVLDAPVAFKNSSSQEVWQPQNFSKTYSGEITFRKALAKSKNIPAVRLIQMLGPSAVVQFAHTMGISSVLSPELSLALGTSEVSLLDLTGTYSVFPNKGRAVKPFSIIAVDDSRGRTIWHPKPEKKVVMSEAGAAIVTDMLVAVVREGTGRKAQMLQKPVAGKTGTTDDFRDAFFIGFSPEITVGVWVGQDGSESLGKGETGAKAALPIWTAFMSAVLKNQPYRYFGIPDSVSQVRMDPRTGTIATDDIPGAVTILVRKP
ncbi:penicillin-binding protein 1A [Thermodesulfobacteriota bacterium]